MSYEHLSDEDKVITAIGFVARGVTMPYQLREFLEKQNLYDLVTNPTTMELPDVNCEGHTV